MTVLHLLGSPRHGGAEVFFLDLVDALHRSGLSQAAAIHANADRERALREMGVPAHVLRFKPPFDFTTGPAIGRLARSLEACILLQWMNRAGRLTPREGPWTRIGRLGGYYDLKYYRGADYLVGNTRDIVDYIVGKGWPADRVGYIPNFATPKDDLPLARSTFDTPDDAPLLLAMGRLHDDKAHDVSLKALALIPEAYLWIAGDGPEEQSLKNLAREIGVARRVRFLGWRLDASALYRSADICLFPSRFEPLGNTVIQAWAHGVPLVTAASQGPGAIVRDGEDGLLTRVEDFNGVAKATQRLIADASLRARLVEGGLERIRTEYNEAAVVAQWRELFARFGET